MKRKNENHLPKRVIIEFLRRHSIRVRRTVINGVHVWEATNPFGEKFHHPSLQGVYWAYQRVAAGKTDDRSPTSIQQMIQEAEILKGLEYQKEKNDKEIIEITSKGGSVYVNPDSVDGMMKQFEKAGVPMNDPQIQTLKRQMRFDHSTWDDAKNGGLTE